MLVYFFTFILSIGFVYLAQMHIKPILAFMCLFIAALIPSVIAGARDLTIGTDVAGYGMQCYNLALSNDYNEFMLCSARWGVLFPLMIYFGALMGDFSWGLGFVEFFICIHVLVALYMQRRKCSCALGYFLFLFLFYNMSLNLMRQSMALSCCLLAFSLILIGKYIIAGLWLVMAFMSHSSMVIFALLIIEYYLFVIKGKNTKRSQQIFYLGLPLILLFYQQLLDKMIDLGFLSEHYSAYSNSTETHFSFTNALSQVLFLIFMRLFAVKKKIYLGYNIFSKYVVYETFVLFSLSVVSIWAFRAAFYSQILYVLLFPMIIRQCRYSHYKYFFLLLVMFVWYYDNAINVSNETYPYKSLNYPMLNLGL